MFKKFFLTLFATAVICNVYADESRFSSLTVEQFLQDFFDYKHFFDSINSLQNFQADCAGRLSGIPAADLHLNIWSRYRVNPYGVSISSLSDSVRVDMSEFVLPVPGRVTSRFGMRRGRPHNGIDLALRTGDPVLAAFSGKVRIIDYQRRGFGHYVVIRHHNGVETLYAHLSRVLVEQDQFVNAGDTIALGGSTGRSTGPHLHFEVRHLGHPINPERLICFANGIARNDYYLITQRQTFAQQREMAAAHFVTVRSGDTLGHIARRHGTTAARIAQLNGITTRTVIRPGQRLRVR